jgi:hypothetical protein
MSEFENKLYNLKLEETYDIYIDTPIKEIMINYTTLLNYYVIYSIENIKSKNLNIFNKGFSLISNVFITILMYTRSLNTTIHHTQKAILYYIEYITQITDKDENMFFNLTLKDAIVYVYTKTIYDINDCIRSKYTMTKYENTLFNILHNLIQNYNNIILYFTKIGSFSDKNITDKKEVLLNIHLLFNEHILKYYNNIYSESISINIKKIEKCLISLYNTPKEDSDNIDDILCKINDGLN